MTYFSVVKAGDRVDNATTMIGVFDDSRLRRYVDEINEIYLPNLKVARRMFPDQEPAYENCKLIIRSAAAAANAYLVKDAK